MSKTVAYVAAAVVCVGIGALVAGLSVWYAHPGLNQQQAASGSRFAKCQLLSTGVAGDVTGMLSLEQSRPTSPVQISGVITGLSQGLHGFHVHQWGVPGVLKRCVDAGAHYNPLGFNHSAPNSTERHVGDLGNVKSFVAPTGTTNAPVDITDNMLTLWGQYSIVGRSIVVHQGEDDLGLGGNDDSLKTGNAGGRAACCTVYLTEQPSN